MRRHSQASQRWMRASAGSSKDTDQRALEVLDDALPGDGFGSDARLRAEPPREAGLARHALRGGDECRLVVEPGEQARATVDEVLARRRVVVGDDAQPARHGLERDVAERL